MMKLQPPAPGAEYGNVRVLDLPPETRASRLLVWCECKCGTLRLASVKSVYRNNIRFCGKPNCPYKQSGGAGRPVVHDGTGTKLYGTWYLHRFRGRLCREWYNSFEAYRDHLTAIGYVAGCRMYRPNKWQPFGPGNVRVSVPAPSVAPVASGPDLPSIDRRGLPMRPTRSYDVSDLTTNPLDAMVLGR